MSKRSRGVTAPPAAFSSFERMSVPLSTEATSLATAASLKTATATTMSSSCSALLGSSRGCFASGPNFKSIFAIFWGSSATAAGACQDLGKCFMATTVPFSAVSAAAWASFGCMATFLATSGATGVACSSGSHRWPRMVTPYYRRAVRRSSKSEEGLCSIYFLYTPNQREAPQPLQSPALGGLSSCLMGESTYVHTNEAPC
mmetsp:Transcript_69782/g.145875  ORF Transcript_69782/g.145875 Transcript_69782/m.145875 type:complete len:201 (-) Transcript_69782:19-621(-)